MSEEQSNSSGGIPAAVAALVVLAMVAGIVLFSIPQCVVAGTLVATPDGPRAIEALEVGDAVWCQAPDGARVAGEVTWTGSASASSHLLLRFAEGSELRVTDQHPLATPQGWSPAGELEPGARVLGEDGPLTLEAVERVAGRVGVHDLSVTPYANFFAGGVLVHNKESRLHSNESAAVGALKSIASSQMLFREADKENDEVFDYGTLAELGATGLISAELATGTAHGYAFEVHVSAEKPESEWIAAARPLEPGRTGGRYFCIDHEGVVYYRTDEPFRVGPQRCAVPEGAQPVGR